MGLLGKEIIKAFGFGSDFKPLSIFSNNLSSLIESYSLILPLAIRTEKLWIGKDYGRDEAKLSFQIRTKAE